MKTARDVAIGVVQEAFGLGGWLRETFLVMLADKCELGANLRKMVDTLERAIEADRKMQSSMRAPS
jgi:hypothetical protein